MAYTIESCEKQWSESCGSLPPEQRRQYNLRWIQYWDHLARREHSGVQEDREPVRRVLDALESAGLLGAGTEVLDVGAGSGAYAIPMARRCKRVTALDMSLESLRLLEERAQESRLNNLETRCGMWEDYDDDRRYDLVFSAMCPAICDVESLARMEALSASSCALLTIGKGSRSELRSALRPLLTDQPLTGLSPDVIYIFNLLYAQGKLPELRFFSFAGQTSMPLEEAMDTYRTYYSIFGLVGERVEAMIRGYLESIAEDGICTDHVKTNLALMTWKPGEGSR